jgi:hypothetical protein
MTDIESLKSRQTKMAQFNMPTRLSSVPDKDTDFQNQGSGCLTRWTRNFGFYYFAIASQQFGKQLGPNSWSLSRQSRWPANRWLMSELAIDWMRLSNAMHQRSVRGIAARPRGFQRLLWRPPPMSTSC